jgi:hypothetical protein
MVISCYRCEQCCTADNCNAYIAELDGIPDSAVMAATNFLLVAAAFLTTLRIY